MNQNEKIDKFQTDNPKCEKCNTPLDYYEEEGIRCRWECPKCNNIEGEHGW